MTNHPKPAWGGLDHLVLITPDMDATVRFYHGVLGMDLVSTFVLGSTRLYSFRLTPTSTVAFFEWSGSGSFAKPAGLHVAGTLQFDHVAYNIADHAALLAVRQRLLDHDVEVTEPIEHGPMLTSIYLHDPAGIAIEISCWAPGALDRDGPVLLDPNPVAAVVELERDGVVSWTPATRLANGLTVQPAVR